ncbi:MAG: DsrE family protein [Acidobacteria bacterium]|nr:DsrE family protein [Acidobacteriota bacterium]
MSPPDTSTLAGAQVAAVQQRTAAQRHGDLPMRLLAFTLSLAALLSTVVPAASAQELPVPGVAPARDVPGAKEMPSTTLVHKVVFDMATANPKDTPVHPMLSAVARYVNTLAKVGVPAANRKIAVVLHQGSTDYIMTNQAYRARHDGQDNPNLAMMQALKKAGVDFRVCGQAALARKIDPKDITPEVQLDLWALTTIIALQQQGYVLVAP